MKDLLPATALPSLAAGRRVWVACSGGLDSIALLHQLWRLGVPGLRAVHVHHGLQALADDWVRRVRAQCRAWDIPLRVERVQVTDGGQGPEAAAREARHAAFAALLRSGDWLVTAHHLDDQAETVLLRALRGTGVQGLAAMATQVSYARGTLWRPLLDIPRTRIERYARAHGLAWVEDPHNHDPRYARSLLRKRVMPVVQRHWPQAKLSLARLATHAREASELLGVLAQQDAQALGLDMDAVSSTGWCLPVSGLLALQDARRRNLLRWCWSQRGWQPPDTAWLARLEREVLHARVDAQPLLPFAQGEARRYRDRLYLMPQLPTAPAIDLSWVRTRQLVLPEGCGVLLSPRAPPRALRVCFAQGGERLRPAGARQHRTLKQLCQEAGIPVWVRERMPLIHDGTRLVSVAGLWNAAELAELKGFVPRWTSALPGAPVCAV